MQLKVHKGKALSITSYYAINSFWTSSVSECSLISSQDLIWSTPHPPVCSCFVAHSSSHTPQDSLHVHRLVNDQQVILRYTIISMIGHSCYTTLLVRESAKKQWQFVALIHQSRSDIGKICSGKVLCKITISLQTSSFWSLTDLYNHFHNLMCVIWILIGTFHAIRPLAQSLVIKRGTKEIFRF